MSHLTITSFPTDANELAKAAVAALVGCVVPGEVEVAATVTIVRGVFGGGVLVANGAMG